MNPAAFFELLKANDPHAISDAIAHEPAIVIRTWHRRWNLEWDGSCWVQSGSDGGWHLITPATWVRAFRQAGYHDGYETAEPPNRPLLLYRGATHARRMGMSWTPDMSAARMYAKYDGADRLQSGNLYSYRARPGELLARLNYEFILDPAYLSDNTVRLECPLPAHCEAQARSVLQPPLSALDLYETVLWNTVTPKGVRPMRPTRCAPTAGRDGREHMRDQQSSWQAIGF